MLSRQQRVNRPAFSGIFRQGKRYHSRYFTLILSTSPDLDSHISFVASRKSTGGAVSRHQAVRRGYSVMKELLPLFKTPMSCIFYFKKDAASLKYNELYLELKHLLNRHGLISGFIS